MTLDIDTLIGGLVGVVVGFLLSYLNEWYRDRRKRSRVINGIAYELNENKLMIESAPIDSTKDEIRLKGFITDIYQVYKVELSLYLKEKTLISIYNVYKEISKFNEPIFYREENGYRVYRYSDIKNLLKIIEDTLNLIKS
jgi:hypothetical protein